MAKFTFKGKKDKFNPNCTSTLLFDNKDGSTERIFCEQTTCVDSHYVPTGVITPCRTKLLPAGYTDDKFIWGVEGGPWVVSIPYSGFGSINNAFYPAGITLSKVKPIADPSGCGWRTFFNGQNYSTTLNAGFFSNSWDNPQGLMNAGYSPMGGDLNGAEIDPAKILGNTIFNPAVTYDYTYGSLLGCGVQKVNWEPPAITYYDVGSSLVPEPHDVVFPDASISLMSTGLQIQEPSLPGFTEDLLYYNTYVKEALAGPNKCGMGYAPEHPPIDMPKVIAAFTDTTGSKSGYSSGFRTGYRMQKYIQKKHLAIYSESQSSLAFGIRHIESIVRPLGYKPVYSFVSAVPRTVYASYHPGFVNYPKIGYAFTAKATVTVRVSYIPFTSNVYEYGPYRDTLPPEWNNGWQAELMTYNGRYLTSPWLGWLWERSNHDNPSQNPQPTIVLGNHYLITMNLVGGKPTWGFAYSHTGSALPDNIASPDDPRRLKDLLYYRKKLNWNNISQPYSMIMSQYSGPGGVLLPPAIGGYARQNAYLPGTPNDFKIFRRKILEASIVTNNSKPIRLSYSNKREWFNGTCPFSLDFNFNKSDHIFIKNNCSSTIVPHIEPSGV